MRQLTGSDPPLAASIFRIFIIIYSNHEDKIIGRTRRHLELLLFLPSLQFGNNSARGNRKISTPGSRNEVRFYFGTIHNQRRNCPWWAESRKRKGFDLRFFKFIQK